MATPRDIRRLALMALYQFDARGLDDGEAIRASLGDAQGWREEGLEIGEPLEVLRDRDFDKAFELAREVYAHRAEADRLLLELAPDWPPHRQAAIDRAILRLGIFEIMGHRTPPKAAINEAVELARLFSTDKSPQFINGVLAAVMKRTAGDKSED
jgi:N utilization substance protein B